MAKWEYCCINWEVREASRQEQQALQTVGLADALHELPDARTITTLGTLTMFSSPEPTTITSLSETMASLGRDGWELVSHTQIVTPARSDVLFFKRQLHE